MAVEQIQIPVLIQDPTVVMDPELRMNAIQPVTATDPRGFLPGPVCRRVAIVDLNGTDGTLGVPVPFDPKGSKYANTATYLVQVPVPERGKVAPWVKRGDVVRVRIQDLAGRDYHEPFLKVSAFGAVLRTIGFIEGAHALGRQVQWAFPGEQLLVVPRAGDLPNAFYHRDSHSLLLYYFDAENGTPQTVYCALSQDIVTHEASHAVIDGIAPDLYHAGSPDSLAIHEALADLTAVLVSLDNRELRNTRSHSSQEMLGSTRFSRVAEQFGAWRGQGQALRDVYNDRTLDPHEPDSAKRVDPASPHSLSEVLSGAVFRVFDRTLSSIEAGGSLPLALLDHLPLGESLGNPRTRVRICVNRIANLIYKGLDWLPPGEVSLADYARSMLAADLFYLPDFPTQREWLTEECRRRQIFSPGAGSFDPTPALGHIDFTRLAAGGEACRRFANDHRKHLGIPGSCRISIQQRVVQAAGQKLFTADDMSGIVRLAGPRRPIRPPADAPQLLLLKVAWETRRPHSLGAEYGAGRKVKVGLTLALRPDGTVHALLRGCEDPEATSRANGFLQRLALAGALLPPGQARGLDGAPLQTGVTTQLQDGALQLFGAFCSLHIADDLLRASCW
jgi:hypothetical protein